MDADLSYAAMESNDDCTTRDVSTLLSLSLKLPDAVHHRNYLHKLPYPPTSHTHTPSHLWPQLLSQMILWHSQRSPTRERSTLTVVSRKQENEAMGVGTHGICTVIMLNLQGRETHGSKTRLVGLSKLCQTLWSHNWHTSMPQKCIHVILFFKYFLLSLVSVRAPIIKVFKNKSSNNCCLFTMPTLYWNNYCVARTWAL